MLIGLILMTILAIAQESLPLKPAEANKILAEFAETWDAEVKQYRMVP